MENAHKECFIHLDKVSYSYGQIQALSEINAHIYKGEMLAIVGPNGGGKSTLLKLLARLLPPQQGTITFDPAFKSHMAYLPQIRYVDRTFPLKAFDVVAMGLWKERSNFGLLTKEQKIDIQDAFQLVGLAGFEDRSLYALSGGQLQRLLFARMFVQNAQVFLLDEPFVGIDHRTTHDLMEILVQWNKQGMTIISVLHDFNLVKKYFPRTFLLSEHLIAAGTSQNVLTPYNLGKALLGDESMNQSQDNQSQDPPITSSSTFQGS